MFRNMQQLCLTNFTLSNCSMWSNISEVKSSLPTTTTTSARVAILIISGTSLTVMSVQVTNNTGTGLAILDTAGNVTIKRSLFAYNKVEEFQFGWSGGLHIQLSGNNEYSSITHQARQSKNKLNSTYTVTHCHFSGNKAYSKSAEQDENFGGQGGGGGGGRGGGGGGGGGGGRGGGRGGGLAVVLDEGTTGNHFYISQSTFDGNIAANDGGGLSILLTGNITNNTISITGSNFSSNLCQSNRGGGASVTWDSSGKQKPLYNMVCFMSCFFVRNRASFGGGVAVLDIRGGYDMSTNTLEFRDTRWERNKAWFGAAVDIRPDVLWYKNTDCYQPTFAFSGCTITENVVITESDLAGAGAMRVSKHHVTFSQFMEFTNNNGSAFILRDSVLKIISGCRLSFNTNNGTVGGAMRLQESSWVTIEGHNGTVEMQFHNNTALYIGGAIVIYTSNTQEVKFSQACFLQCLNKQEIKMHFRGNFAGINDHAAISNLSYPIRVTSDGSGFGDIIFATTLNPCMKVCHGYSVEENDYDYLNYTCNQCFITLNVSKPTNELDAHRASTSALYIDFPGDGPIKLIPGKETHLNLTTYDDLDQLIRTSYRATVTEGSSSITLDRQYGQMSNSSLILYGFPNSKGTVRLEASGVLGLTKFIDVELDNCPPG